MKVYKLTVSYALMGTLKNAVFTYKTRNFDNPKIVESCNLLLIIIDNALYCPDNPDGWMPQPNQNPEQFRGKSID